MGNYGNLIKTIDTVTKALDQLIDEDAQTASARRQALAMLQSGGRPSEVERMKSNIQIEAESRLELHKALTALQNSKTNAEAHLEKMAAQAKKDIENLSSGASEASAAEAKAKTHFQEVAAGIEQFMQKASFPLMDVKNIMNLVRTDKNLHNEPEYQKLVPHLEAIEKSMHEIVTGLQPYPSIVRSFPGSEQ